MAWYPNSDQCCDISESRSSVDAVCSGGNWVKFLPDEFEDEYLIASETVATNLDGSSIVDS